MSEEIIKRVLDLAEENKSLREKLSKSERTELGLAIAQDRYDQMKKEVKELKSQNEELRSQLRKLQQEKLEAKWVWLHLVN